MPEAACPQCNANAKLLAVPRTILNQDLQQPQRQHSLTLEAGEGILDKVNAPLWHGWNAIFARGYIYRFNSTVVIHLKDLT